MIHDNLKKLREEIGLTQKQVANYLNVTRSTYSYYETGRSLPSIQSLIKLSEIFGISCDYILNEKVSSENLQRISDTINESTEKEHEMLFYFRIIPADTQDKVLDILKNIYERTKLKNPDTF